MYTFLLYIIKVSLTLAAFYLFYKLLCSRDTWHRANRILLLTILALSAAIPFIYIDLGTINAEASVVIEELSMVLTAEPVADGTEAVSTTQPTLWQRIPWQKIPWRTLLASIYLIGLVVYLTKFIGGLVSIALLIHRSKCREMADGTILVTHNKDYSPFSWMRYIIVSERDLDENYDMILAHERAHIRLHHSWDLFFVQLCATAQWFNPAAWLLKRELEAIHEYEADSATLHEGFDARQYQLRLFEAATGVKYSSFTNNFINCSTKKRIIMMMKKQTSPWALLKALYVLPVAFAAVAVISCTSPKEKTVENQDADMIVETNGKGAPLLVLVLPDGTEMYKTSGENWVDEYNKDSKSYLAQFNLTQMSIDAIKVLKEDEAKSAYGERAANGAMKFYLKGTTDKEILAAMSQHAKKMGNEGPLRVTIKKPEGQANNHEDTAQKGEIFMVAEEQPMFPGGMAELMKYLQKEIKYPKEAMEKKIQGRVIVQFVVNKDGSICEDTVVKSVDPQLDAEAIRVIRSMPDWTPGKQKGEPVRVRFTLPVTFRMQGEAAPKTDNPTQMQMTLVKENADDGDKIFQVAEEQPMFPGGMEELMKYLQKEIKYPKEAQDKGTQGRVIVQFVVNKDGSICEAKVMKPVDPLLDAEALRVVNAMPNWTPAKQKGEPVRVRFTLPVSFRLSN